MNDVEAIKKIRNAIFNSIQELSNTDPELFDSEKFGFWATAALMDYLCLSAQTTGIDQETLINAIKEDWSVVKNTPVLN